MKTVRINGVDQEIPSGTLVFEDFLKDLNQGLNENRQVISSIKINGLEITENDEATLKATPVESIGDVEITISNPADLAYETLNTLEQYIDRLVASVDRAAMHYISKNLISGDAYFAKSIDGLDLFVQTIGGIKLALRIGLNTKVALTEATLVSIMNDLLEAKRQNNYVFLAELLQKDLVENLHEWKNEIFTLFRSWKTS